MLKKFKNNLKWIVIISLLIVNMAASIFLLFNVFVFSGQEFNSGGVLNFETVVNGQYVLYIGLNDKDTYEQIIPTDEAIQIVNSICAKYAGGYTVSRAEGGWIDEKGVLTQENTLIYTISYADESVIIAIMDKVLAALNQNSILVEKRDISSVFYP